VTSSAPISCAHPAQDAVYIDPAVKAQGEWRLVIAHELGHVWDYQHLNDSARARYAALVGAAGAPWLSTGGALLTNTFADLPPGETFAEAYALCALGPRYRQWNLTNDTYFGPSYGEDLSRTEVAATCWLLHHPSR